MTNRSDIGPVDIYHGPKELRGWAVDPVKLKLQEEWLFMQLGLSLAQKNPSAAVIADDPEINTLDH